MLIQEAIWSFSVSVSSGSTRRATEEQLVWFCWSPAGADNVCNPDVGAKGQRHHWNPAVPRDICAYKNENGVFKLAPSEDFFCFLSCPLFLSSLLRSASSGYKVGYFFSPLCCLHKAQNLSQLRLFSTYISPLRGKFELHTLQMYTAYVFPMICFHRENIDLPNLKAFMQMHIYLSENFVRKILKKQLLLDRTWYSAGLIESEFLFISLSYVDQMMQKWKFLVTSWLSSVEDVFIRMKN